MRKWGQTTFNVWVFKWTQWVRVAIALMLGPTWTEGDFSLDLCPKELTSSKGFKRLRLEYCRVSPGHVLCSDRFLNLLAPGTRCSFHHRCCFLKWVLHFDSLRCSLWFLSQTLISVSSLVASMKYWISCTCISWNFFFEWNILQLLYSRATILCLPLFLEALSLSPVLLSKWPHRKASCPTTSSHCIPLICFSVFFFPTWNCLGE